MSWAEEQSWFGLEDLAIEAEAEKKRRIKRMRAALDTGIHTDIDGNKIDVRQIDSRYARNLYRWYLRRLSLFDMTISELKETNLMKILESRSALNIKSTRNYKYRGEDINTLEETIHNYYHTVTGGEKIDVREIDARYAANLYNWYLNKAKDDEERENAKKSKMLIALEKIMHDL